MCGFLVCAIFAMKLLEDEIVEIVDESQQTIEDYSLCVTDPPPDATEPDEWLKFFSRFGVVRYITVTKVNGELINLLLKKQILLRQLKSEAVSHRQYPVKKQIELNSLEAELTKAYLKTYPASQVFVTFEHEDHQRLAFSELEVPDIQTITDDRTGIAERQIFRGTDVLAIEQPSEPDSIIWKNTEVPESVKRANVVLGFFLALGMNIVV